jgi:hypothetical protein
VRFQPILASLIGRRAQLSLPVLSVVVVALAVLVVGKPRPVIGVRFLGGPTDDARVWSFRLEVCERLGDRTRPLARATVAVEAEFGGGETHTIHATLDDEGALPVAFAPARGVVGAARVRVIVARRSIADVRVALSRASWAAGARHRGGWVASRANGGVVLRAAAERGVFAVPFRDGLWVDVTGAQPGGASLSIDADGADVVPGPLMAELSRSRFFVTPREHSASVGIVARTKEQPDAHFDVSLAVVPGALRAELRGKELVIQSPIVRDRAYVAIVTQTERVNGATVALSPDPRGGAIGSIPLSVPSALLPDEPLWAVVSSEPELASSSTVGWPVRYSTEGEPPTTFDVRDALLRDTIGDEVEREAERCRRVRLLAAAFAGLSLALTGVLVSRAAQMAKLGLEEHLERAGAEKETASRVARSGEGSALVLVVALLCIGLGAVMLAIFAAWQ